MKRVLISLMAVLAIALLPACQTAGTTQISVADTAARICPPVRAVMLTLSLSPGVSENAKEKLKEADPIVVAACAGASTGDLKAMVNTVAPLVMTMVLESDLSDTEKQNAIILLTVAQVAVTELR